MRNVSTLKRNQSKSNMESEMLSKQELEEAINIIDAKLNGLQKERHYLNNLLTTLKSKEFIELNQITKDGVIHSDGKDVPHFHTVYKFGKWLSDNSDKHWTEWNGRIYLTADLIKGKMPDTPGLYEDL